MLMLWGSAPCGGGMADSLKHAPSYGVGIIMGVLKLGSVGALRAS